MARRKNSAEMLDVLRRMSQDEKVRKTRQLQKAALPPAALPPAAQGSLPPPAGRGLALPPPGFAGSGRALPPPDAAEARPPIFAGVGDEAEQPAGEDAVPSRMRKSFLAVLRGGREETAVSSRLPPATEEEALIAVEAPETSAAAAAPAAVPAVESREVAVEPPPSGKRSRRGGRRKGSKSMGPAGANGDSAHIPRAPGLPAKAPETPSETEAQDPEADAELAAASGALETVSEPAALPATGLHPASADELLPVDASEGSLLPASGLPASRPELPLRKAPPAPPSRPGKRPLFGSLPEEAGVRGVLARAARTVKGELVGGALRRLLDLPILTILLYVAVALLAMLTMALFMNQRENAERSKFLNETETDAEPAGGSPPLAVEITPGKGLPPEVRRVEKAPESPPAPKPAEEPAAPEAAPAAGGPGGDKIMTGEKGLPGFYVQIQSGVIPEHAGSIISHLQVLGYKNIWQRPMKDRATQCSIIRLGPYPTREAAQKELLRFKTLIAKTPVKKPRLTWDPFIVRVP